MISDLFYSFGDKPEDYNGGWSPELCFVSEACNCCSIAVYCCEAVAVATEDFYYCCIGGYDCAFVVSGEWRRCGLLSMPYRVLRRVFSVEFVIYCC